MLHTWCCKLGSVQEIYETLQQFSEISDFKIRDLKNISKRAVQDFKGVPDPSAGKVIEFLKNCKIMHATKKNTQVLLGQYLENEENCIPSYSPVHGELEDLCFVCVAPTVCVSHAFVYNVVNISKIVWFDYLFNFMVVSKVVLPYQSTYSNKHNTKHNYYLQATLIQPYQSSSFLQLYHLHTHIPKWQED